MAWKGVLTIGSTIEITFSADAQNEGSTALSSLLIPTAGAPAPTPLLLIVGPAGKTKKQEKIPAAVQALRIDVDLPDGGEGTLTVSDGVDTWSEELTDDDTWIFSVTP
jgi:hypothetical protein